MQRYFGTDGVRGVANKELTPELAFQLGRYGAYVLANQNSNPKIVVGRDTRLSGEMLEAALIAGILSTGVDVIRLGVIPTPGVAFLTRHLEADAGVMISASHNAFYDNGIKFFGSNGFKLSDETENEIESYLHKGEDETIPRPIADRVGRIMEDEEAVSLYLDHLKTTIDTDLCGMHIVMDCANGAAYQVAPHLLRELGADVTAMNMNPDGININHQCGSTHPERLQEEVLKKQAHLGLAFDGDADRLIAVDEKGELIDGDYILSICGEYLKERQLLAKNTIVTTVMSNIGFFKRTEALEIQTEKTKVGDRYVIQKMLEGGYTLGGEQSGHIIFLDYNTTGDGLLTAIQLLRVVKEKAQSLSDLSHKMKKYPQVLVNVPVKDKTNWDQNEVIQAAMNKIEQALGENGRLLVRPSGTEPLIRIMAEGPQEQVIKEYVAELVEIFRKELG